MGQQERETHLDRCWESLNFVIWFSIMLIFLVVQIVVSLVFLIISKNEKPHIPLRAWNIGYLSGCLTALCLLLWGYKVQKKVFVESFGNILGLNRADIDNRRAEICVTFLKLILHCFFLSWFIVGCIWVSKASSSRSDAPKLFRLCIVNIIFCGVGYIHWIIISIHMCCCLPCVLYFYAFLGLASS